MLLVYLLWIHAYWRIVLLVQFIWAAVDGAVTLCSGI